MGALYAQLAATLFEMLGRGGLGEGAAAFGNMLRGEEDRELGAAREAELDRQMGRLSTGYEGLWFPRISMDGRFITGQEPGISRLPGGDTMRGEGTADDPGYSIRPPQAEFNLDEMFNVGRTGLEAFEELYPDAGALTLPTYQSAVGPIDMGALRGDVAGLFRGGGSALQEAGGDIADIFGGARLQPGSLASQINFPEADLSGVLSANLAGLGEAGRKRETLAQEQLAGSAAQFGGLENLQRQSQALGFEESGQRGLEAALATGQTRLEESAIEQANATIQKDLATTEAQINQYLASAEAIERGDLGVAEADLAADEAGLLPFLLAEETSRGQLGLDEAELNRLIGEGNIGRLTGRAETEIGYREGAEQDIQDKGLLGLDMSREELHFNQGILRDLVMAFLGQYGLLGNAGLFGQDSYDMFSAYSAINANNAGGGGGGGGISGTLDPGGFSRDIKGSLPGL